MNDQNIGPQNIWCPRRTNPISFFVWTTMLVFLGAALSWAAPAIVAKPVITDLSNPIAIANAGDGSGRLFIALQNGRIIIYGGTQVLSTSFLDISSLVSSGSERGLLSVAFHPNFASNGFFYVSYTNINGDTVIARYSVSGNPNIADPNSALLLLTINQPFSNHNGGQLQFGQDGYLYIGMGDGGSGGDPQNNAQNLNTLLGKILRIDVDGGFPYVIPPDNPFLGTLGARDEIWSLGLRNPWRFSFDRLTGDLFLADVGQESWEEVNFQPASSLGGENYGWRLMEGNHCFNPSSGCNSAGLTLPIIEYNHSVGCSITGGYRYRGKENQDLEGIYFYGDFCTGRIWGGIEDVSGVWTTSELLDTSFLISTFGEDENGEIYFAHYSSSDGAIYQVETGFEDVPQGYWAEDHIYAIFDAGITNGCSQNPLMYCPKNDVTREQMAAFIVRAVEGEPPANYCGTGSPFSDVSSSSVFCKYIKRLSELGITQGCGGGNYCPKTTVTRDQMAAFLVRAVEGEPPANYCDTGSPFSDVSPASFFCKYIKRLSELGITNGCGGGNYCPNNTVKRDQMAVFLGRAFLGMD